MEPPHLAHQDPAFFQGATAVPAAPGAPSSSSSPSHFPKLEILNPSSLHTFIGPSKQIHDGPDVAHFLTSKAYRDIGIFLMQLNRAMCPRKTGPGRTKTFPLSANRDGDPPSVRRLCQLLERAGSFIDEAPPDPGPRRFGNVSFRTWHRLLEERVGALLEEFVAEDVLQFGSDSLGTRSQDATASDDGKAKGPADELKAYFLGGFGSAQRLDYGTGHELSFLAFLGCLWKLGAFQEESGQEGQIERSIVLGVLEP